MVALTPENSWKRSASISSVGYANGSVSFSNSSSAQVSFSFKGIALYIYGTTKYDRGWINLTLDDDTFQFDQFSTTFDLNNKILFFQTGLKDQNHQVTMVNSGNDSDPRVLKYTSTPYIAFNSAIVTVTNQTSSSTDGGGSKGTSKLGPILGAVVGSLAIIALLIFGIRRYRYRKYPRPWAREIEIEGRPSSPIQPMSLAGLNPFRMYTPVSTNANEDERIRGERTVGGNVGDEHSPETYDSYGTTFVPSSVSSEVGTAVGKSKN